MIFLPDPKTNQLELDEKIKQLKERITNIHSPNYFFKEYSENFSVPFESNGIYMQSVWNKILHNQNNNDFSLDLTESKFFIINFMFETLKNRVYKEILVSFLMKIKKQIADNEYVDLSIVGKEIFDKSNYLFQIYSKNYFKTNESYVKEKELHELLSQDLLDIFKKQVIMLKKTSSTKLNELISTEKLTCKFIN